MGIQNNCLDTYKRTPFQRALGGEALILIKVKIASYMIAHYDKRKNEERTYLNLDLLDEVMVATEQRMTRYQDFMAKHYNTKVKPQHFSIGDLILKKMTTATKDPMQGKLGPNWEGPYRITNCNRKGSYYLETLDGQRLHHPWNTDHLRRYYQYYTSSNLCYCLCYRFSMLLLFFKFLFKYLIGWFLADQTTSYQYFYSVYFQKELLLSIIKKGL